MCLIGRHQCAHPEKVDLIQPCIEQGLVKAKLVGAMLERCLAERMGVRFDFDDDRASNPIHAALPAIRDGWSRPPAAQQAFSVVKVRYIGIVDANAAFRELRPLWAKLGEMQQTCRP